MKQNLRWMRLDNAALIYPAARRRNWTNVFRISVSFRDDVDAGLLQQALNKAVARFPSVAARLRTGVFWYYLEQIPEVPQVQPEELHPLNRMTFRSIRRCAFRVLYYRNRMAVELFHSIADGTGGLIFVKSLAAEYVRLRYGVSVDNTHGVLDLNDAPQKAELEDSFMRHASPVALSRKEEIAYPITGTREPDRFLHVTTGILDADEVRRLAKSYGATVTVFLAAVMMKAVYEIQNERVPNPNRRKPVKVLIPVNLRKLFESETLRNFANYVTPGIDPRMGEFSFEEMIAVIHHQMGLELNPKRMSAKFTPNVRDARSKILRIMPLFVKNLAMKMVYNQVGERTASICMSNLGLVELPEGMTPFVQRIDFVLGIQADSPCNCGVCSYGGKLRVSFTRGIAESELERRFFTELREMGLHVLVESNTPHT